MEYYSTEIYRKCKIEVLMSMNFEKEKLLPSKLPSFYAEVIVSWHLCGGGLKAPQYQTRTYKGK